MRRHRARLVPPALLLLAGGCDGPAAGGAPDAGADAAPDGAGSEEPVLPAPDLPRLTDWECPEGWIPTPAGEGEPWAFSYCAPPPRRACEGASLQLPGDPECRRLGTACPEGGDGFPEEAELRALAPGFDGVIRYVDAGARLGGDGSRGAPFRTVAEASSRWRRAASGAESSRTVGSRSSALAPRGPSWRDPRRRVRTTAPRSRPWSWAGRAGRWSGT